MQVARKMAALSCRKADRGCLRQGCRLSYSALQSAWSRVWSLDLVVYRQSPSHYRREYWVTFASSWWSPGGDWRRSWSFDRNHPYSCLVVSHAWQGPRRSSRLYGQEMPLAPLARLKWLWSRLSENLSRSYALGSEAHTRLGQGFSGLQLFVEPFQGILLWGSWSSFLWLMIWSVYVIWNRPRLSRHFPFGCS